MRNTRINFVFLCGLTAIFTAFYCKGIFGTEFTSLDLDGASGELLKDIVFSGHQKEEIDAKKVVSLDPDEVIEEPLRRLAFGSCQRSEINARKIYNSILNFAPDLFLYTGDIVYPKHGCCEGRCMKEAYEKLESIDYFREFRKKLKRMDGIYDDHDFGINDGHGNYPYKAESKKHLLDFLGKSEDNYRRKRDGAYFSIAYRDPVHPENTIKIIVLDVRYNRDCYYYCECLKCAWNRRDVIMHFFKRFYNYIFGYGCEHPGDTLGEEQWKWLEGQLHESDAIAHVIVSSMQVFTNLPITESWGLLPLAKRRLSSLILKTKPKNLIFISGDIHYGEILKADGVVEITSSSLTHSLLDKKESISVVFRLFLYLFKGEMFMYNNFGGIVFDYDHKTGTLKWESALYNAEGSKAMSYENDRFSSLTEPYENLDSKKSFFNEGGVVKCRGISWKYLVSWVAFVLVAWLLQLLYILISFVKSRITKLVKYKIQ